MRFLPQRHFIPAHAFACATCRACIRQLAPGSMKNILFIRKNVIYLCRETTIPCHATMARCENKLTKAFALTVAKSLPINLKLLQNENIQFTETDGHEKSPCHSRHSTCPGRSPVPAFRSRQFIRIKHIAFHCSTDFIYHSSQARFEIFQRRHKQGIPQIPKAKKNYSSDKNLTQTNSSI